MLPLGFATFGVALWTTWVPLAAGALVTSLVIGSVVIYGRLRRPPTEAASREEDLPWKDLLRQLEKRNRDRARAGLPPEKATEEVLEQLLVGLPALPHALPVELPEDRDFRLLEGDERRSGQRRWGNPIEVHLLSSLWPDHLHGLVVNRSTGGFGIFTDRDVPSGTPLRVRPAEAPWYVPAVLVEVRHCRKIGKGHLFGCELSEEIPWNVRVWFG